MGCLVQIEKRLVKTKPSPTVRKDGKMFLFFIISNQFMTCYGPIDKVCGIRIYITQNVIDNSQMRSAPLSLPLL